MIDRDRFLNPPTKRVLLEALPDLIDSRDMLFGGDGCVRL